MKKSADQNAQALIQFLEGRLSLPELSCALSDLIIFDFKLSPNYREISKNDLQDHYKITVEPKHVKDMLLKYISNDVTEQELSDWAAFIFLSMVYIPEGSSEGEKEVAGEGPVWDIIQRLITPDIFDGLNIEVASSYLSWLIK